MSNWSIQVFPGTTAQAGASAVHWCEFWLLLASSSTTTLSRSEFEYNSDALDALVPLLLRSMQELRFLHSLIQTRLWPQHTAFGQHRTIWMRSRIYFFFFCICLSNCNRRLNLQGLYESVTIFLSFIQWSPLKKTNELTESL